MAVFPFPTCRVVVPPSKEACGKGVTHKVTFTDEDWTPACQACAIHLAETARAHGTIVKVEKWPATGDGT